MGILATDIFGNTVSDYLFSLIVIAVAWLVIFVVKKILISLLNRIAKRRGNELDKEIAKYIEGLSVVFYIVVSLCIGLSILKLPEIVHQILLFIVYISALYYGVKFVNKLIDHFFSRIKEEQKKEFKEKDFSQLNLIVKFIKAVVWFIAILILLSKLGIDITALIAGLGIGGIAVAFALQNILADVFASFSIYFDKPFKEGDFITVGNESGTIKKIGLKTTRLESFISGEEIAVPNRTLVDSIVHNYQNMDFRRVKLIFRVEYNTDVKQLEKIPKYVKEIIESIKVNGEKIAKLNRVHLANLGDFAIEYEVLYTINSNDYDVYMDVRQEINLELIKKFRKEGIKFAYPSQAVYLKSDKKDLIS